MAAKFTTFTSNHYCAFRLARLVALGESITNEGAYWCNMRIVTLKVSENIKDKITFGEVEAKLNVGGDRILNYFVNIRIDELGLTKK